MSQNFWQLSVGRLVEHPQFGQGKIEQIRNAGSQILVCFDKEKCHRWLFAKEVTPLERSFSARTESTAEHAITPQLCDLEEIIEHPVYGRGEILLTRNHRLEAFVCFLDDGSKRWIKRKEPNSPAAPCNHMQSASSQKKDELSRKVEVSQSGAANSSAASSTENRAKPARSFIGRQKSAGRAGKSPNLPSPQYQARPEASQEKLQNSQVIARDMIKGTELKEQAFRLFEQPPTRGNLKLLPIFSSRRIERFSHYQLNAGYRALARISELDFPTRLKKYLNAMGFETLGELLLAVPQDLLKYKYLTQEELGQLRRCIELMFYKLGIGRGELNDNTGDHRIHSLEESPEDRMITLSDVAPDEKNLALLPLFSSRPIEYFTPGELHEGYRANLEITELPFSPRVRRFLNAMGYDILGKLLLATPSELFEYQYFTRSDFREVEKVVKTFIHSGTDTPSKDCPIFPKENTTSISAATDITQEPAFTTRARYNAPLLMSKDPVCTQCEKALAALEEMVSRKVRRVTVGLLAMILREMCEESCSQFDKHRHQIIDTAFMAKLFVKSGGYYVLERDYVVASPKWDKLEKEEITKYKDPTIGKVEETKVSAGSSGSIEKDGGPHHIEMGKGLIIREPRNEEPSSHLPSGNVISATRLASLLRVGLMIEHNDYGRGRLRQLRRNGEIFLVKFEGEPFERWLWTEEHVAKVRLIGPENAYLDKPPCASARLLREQGRDSLMEPSSEIARHQEHSCSAEKEETMSKEGAAGTDMQSHSISIMKRQKHKINI